MRIFPDSPGGSYDEIPSEKGGCVAEMSPKNAICLARVLRGTADSPSDPGVYSNHNRAIEILVGLSHAAVSKLATSARPVDHNYCVIAPSHLI